MSAEDRFETDATPLVKEEDKQDHIIKCSFTLYISRELAERVRNAVYWTPGITVSTFAEEALNSAVNRQEELNGAPFKERDGGLKRGKIL